MRRITTGRGPLARIVSFFLILTLPLLPLWAGEGQTLFITGIAGFIGFHTAMEAHHRGYTVIGMDNFNAYYDPALKRARAEILAKNGIEVLPTDLCDRTQMEAIFNTWEFDNLGCSQPHTTVEIVAEIERALGTTATIISTDKPNVDATKTHADISNAQTELAYQPKVFLPEGIDRFLSWMKEYEPELFQ